MEPGYQKMKGVLIAGPCPRKVRDSALLPLQLEDRIMKRVSKSHKFQVATKQIHHAYQWDLVSHALWFRFLDLETTPWDTPVNEYLFQLTGAPAKSASGNTKLIWVPNQSLPLSNDDFDKLSLDDRSLSFFFKSWSAYSLGKPRYCLW